jgi:hypothetical protein
MRHKFTITRYYSLLLTDKTDLEQEVSQNRIRGSDQLSLSTMLLTLLLVLLQFLCEFILVLLIDHMGSACKQLFVAAKVRSVGNMP